MPTKASWQKVWSKRQSIRLSEAWCFGSVRFKELYGTPFPKQKIEIHDTFGVGYFDSAEYTLITQHFVERIKNETFDTVVPEIEKTYQDFLTYCKTLGRDILSQCSNGELSLKLKDFLKREDEWMHAMWPIFILDEALSKELQSFVDTKDGAEKQEIFHLVLTPERKTAALQFQLDLLSLVVIEGGIPHEDALERIREKYAYFPILNMDEGELSLSDVMEEAKRLFEEVSDPQEYIKEKSEKDIEVTIAFTNLLSTLPLQEKNLIEAIRRVGFLREYRNDVRQEAYFYARKLYKEIAHRASLDISDAIFCTRAELLLFLAGEKELPNSEILSARKQYSCIFFSDGVKVRYEWQEEKKEVMAADLEVFKRNELKGTVAFRGKVSGRVKVILNVSEQGGEFEKGDVLVSTTTNLAFVPLMAKAVAIVTDEGSLLTHTAIVAREMKKPCIIGTKIATKVLKDGDMVEVDAEKGIVRIIEKS